MTFSVCHDQKCQIVSLSHLLSLGGLDLSMALPNQYVLRYVTTPDYIGCPIYTLGKVTYPHIILGKMKTQKGKVTCQGYLAFVYRTMLVTPCGLSVYQHTNVI